MRSCRATSQSMAAYKSSSSASATASSSASVVVCHSRVVASFEHGCSNRSAIIATTRSRSRLRFVAITVSNPIFLIVPKTASTCPCGSVRSVSNKAAGETSISSRNRRRNRSILCGGHSDRLARVRLRVFLPSRQPSRRRIAGGELRLGTDSIYMGAIIDSTTRHVNIYMGTYCRSLNRRNCGTAMRSGRNQLILGKELRPSGIWIMASTPSTISHQPLAISHDPALRLARASASRRRRLRQGLARKLLVAVRGIHHERRDDDGVAHHVVGLNALV